MKKVLIIVIAAIGLITSIFFSFRNEGAVSTPAARLWPGQMGTLNRVEDRWPQLQANDASVKLTSLAKELPKNDPLDDFVAHEITRGELTIGEPPAVPDVAAIRELLLRETIVWEREDGIGGGNEMNAMRTMHMTIARSLVASALTKARANAPAAWDDLHAVWKLARTLDGHPQMMLQTAALAMARMINAVAWKMPLPSPAWLAELQARDDVRLLLDSYQHQTAYYWQSQGQIFPTKWLASSIDHDRLIADDLFNFTGCDVNTPMNQLGTDLTSVWRRAFRYRAEREATANALRVREGKSIENRSRCSDGEWTFDGTTLRFSREIATASPDTPMPLVLRIQTENRPTLSVGISHQLALDVIRECGGQDITSNLAVIGPNSEWPLSGLFWSFEDYNSVLEIAGKDGNVVEIGYWTVADFSESKSHRSKSRRSLKSLIFDKQARTLKTQLL